MSFLFVGSCKFSAAHITAERFFAGMRANVRRQVVGTRKRTHTYATLKRFLAGMDANVSRQLIGPRKATITIFDGTRVRTFVHRCFARTIRVFSRFDRHQFQRQRTLLVDLRQDFVALARGRIVFGQLYIVRNLLHKLLAIVRTGHCGELLLLWYEAGRR